MKIKKHIVMLVVMAIFMMVASPTSALDLLQPSMHFSLVDSWNVEATGNIMLVYHCRIHGQWFATLHDVVVQGFEVMENSKKGFLFPTRYFDVEGPGGVYGYVVKKYPSVYIRLIPERWGYRWEILATDPDEDGINGNEIPR